MQGVGNVLKGGDDRAAVHRRRLVEGGVRSALLMQQGARIKDRLRHVASNGPKRGAGRDKQLTYLVSSGAGIAGQRELRQLSGGGDADLCAGGMQLRLGRLDVRTLLDQFRRQADRQISRQLQRGELELLGRLLAGRSEERSRQ